MAPAKLLGILLLFFIFLKSGHCGKKKGKTIKIHVPYYVKHIHHYKKIYVPKVQVIKHEHHHKKEHDHHHHHHGHEHDHGHYHSYDKAGHGYADESNNYDTYYDDIDSRKLNGVGGRYGKGRRGKFGIHRASGSEQYQGWRDVDGTEYRGEDSLEDEEDYTDLTGPGDLIPGPGPTPYRNRIKSPNLVIPVYRKRIRGSHRFGRRSDDGSESEEEEEEEESVEEPEAPSTTSLKNLLLAKVTTLSTPQNSSR